MTDDEGPRPRYHWIKDEHISPLFSGWDGERQFGRIIQPANRPSRWDWNLSCLAGVKDITKLAGWHGSEETARLAAKACEDAYDAAMAGKLFGMTPEDVEGILERERFMLARREGRG